MNTLTKQTIGYFWNKTRVYKIALGIAILGVFLGVIFHQIAYGLIFKEFFDSIFSQDPTVDVLSQAFKLLWYLLGSMLLFHIGWRIAELGVNYMQPSAMRDIENDVFESLQNQSYNFFANSFGGALVTKTNRLVRAYETINDTLIFDLTPLLLKIIFTIGVIFYFSQLLGSVILIWLLSYVIIFGAMYKWKFKYDSNLAQADSKVTANLADSVTNILNTKVFAKKQYEKNRFYDVSYERYKKRKLTWDLSTMINFFQGLFLFAGEILLLYIAIVQWSQEIITSGTIILLQFYLFAIMGTVWNIGRMMRNVFEAFADSEEMIEIINDEPDLKDIENSQECRISKGEIEFKKVDFMYYDSKQIFQNLNLNIKSKQSIGLVGESGAGKSTITKLLLRFADINSGEILIDGQDISKITQEQLREKIAYVPQDSILFHRSLKENITYSNPNALFEDVVEAAKKANIHDFIDSLPEKYDTLVGERGIKLSGGERQRVAIARAMLKDAPIVILDEATSSLDSKSEQLIQKAIENLMKHKTTIVIAHRLSTIKKVDRIIVLNNGKIIEEGSHTQLVKKKGKYHELWKHQSSNI